MEGYQHQTAKLGENPRGKTASTFMQASNLSRHDSDESMFNEEFKGSQIG